MEALTDVIDAAGSFLQRLQVSAAPLDASFSGPNVFVLIVLVALVPIGLIAFAATSRNLPTLLGATLLAVLQSLLLLAPDHATALVAGAAGMGSLLITVVALRVRRNARHTARRLDKLS